MWALLGTLVDNVGLQEVINEGKDLITAIICQIGAFIRLIVSVFIQWMSRIYIYLSENPLMGIRTVAFICSLLS